MSLHDDVERADLISKLSDGLDGRTLLVLIKRFGLDGPKMTLEECGEMLGISGSRIRQIEVRALRKMRVRAKQLHLDAPIV